MITPLYFYKVKIFCAYINNCSLNYNIEDLHWGNDSATSDNICVEDGFIRSNGLGCNFYYPYSLIFDKQGIYYDSTRPSDFEVIVNNSHLTYADQKSIDETKKLLRFIIDNDITKYEQGKNSEKYEPTAWSPLLKQISPGQKIILIPSQVPSDASLKYGGCGYTTEKLVKEVRKSNPDAFIILKEHPDVLFGHRPGKLGPSPIREFVDYVCSDLTSILSLIDLADEIHTISSLAGFEALIRKKKVVCYGMPFYAGWGLTEDKNVCPRRIAKPTLEELVHCALIKYPTYFDWDTMRPSTALDTCKRLLQGPSKRNNFLYSMGFIFRFLRMFGLCR